MKLNCILYSIEEDAEDDEKEELSELYKEAEIPIEEIISRYNERKSVKNEGQPGSSKVLQSPFLKAPQRPKPKSSSMFVSHYF